MAADSPQPEVGAAAEPPSVAGFRPFPAGNERVTPEAVDELRDIEGV